ncbi:MAG: hypothetical protein ABIC40_07520 [bacterium]
MRKNNPAYILTLFVPVIFGLAFPPACFASWDDNLPENLRINGRFFTAMSIMFEKQGFSSTPSAELNFRLNGTYKFNSDLKTEFACQIDGLYNENLALASGAGFGSTSGPLRLERTIDNRKNHTATVSFDRLYFDYRNDNMTLDLGRQRIAWGSVNLISFLDAFHPVRTGNPFVPEQGGTDAVRFQYATGPVGGFDILYAWLDEKETRASAIKYHDTFGDFESAISVGRKEGANFAAVETSGDVDDIGIRIESAFTETESGGEFLVALESDYAPNNLTYLSGEIFYNGTGATEPLKYDLEKILKGDSYPARLYAGAYCTYIPSGLQVVSVTGIINLNDDSRFADLALLHSISENCDLRIGYQRYDGKLLSQYGAFPDFIYLISTTYF